MFAHPVSKLIHAQRIVLMHLLLGWLFLFAVLLSAALLFTMVFYVSTNAGCLICVLSDIRFR